MQTRAESPSQSFGALGVVLRSINTWMHRVLLLLAQAALLAMVGILTISVIQRYVFNFNLAWVEEIPRLLVTLLAFVSCAIGVRDHMHVSMNIIYDLFPKGGKRVIDWLCDLLVFFAGLAMLVYGATITTQQMSRPGHLPITGIPNWVQYLSVPVAGLLIAFDSLLFLTGVLKRAELLYSEPEIDYVELVREQQKELKAQQDNANMLQHERHEGGLR